MFKGRSTIEVMILCFTGIVVFVMLVTSLTIVIVEIQSEGDANTDNTVDALTALITTILGALLGLIAGKSSTGGPPPSEPPPP